MSRNISWNICRGIATSAIWKATWRPWLTTFAPILISFSFRLVSDQSLIGWASPLVLRCHSPDAIGGFYNLDIHREPNAIVLRNMRKRGEALANRYRVEFIDTTGDIVMPDIPEPERRKQEETTTDGTSLSAIRHRARRRGLVFSKSRPPCIDRRSQSSFRLPCDVPV